jgi:hypothetical protein
VVDFIAGPPLCGFGKVFETKTDYRHPEDGFIRYAASCSNVFIDFKSGADRFLFIRLDHIWLWESPSLLPEEW